MCTTLFRCLCVRAPQAPAFGKPVLQCDLSTTACACTLPAQPRGGPFLVNGHLNSGARGWPDPYNQRINDKLNVCKRARCHSTLQTCYAPCFGARTQFLCNQNPLADFGVERVEWGPPCCPGSCRCFCTTISISYLLTLA